MKSEHKNIIENCEYIQNEYKYRNSTDEYCSLAYLLKDLELTQSDKIKLGRALEIFLNDYLKSNASWKKLDYLQTNIKCQIDELIINNDKKMIVYSEYKSNIALDSQKRKVMFDHCNSVHTRLKGMYPDYIVSGYIVNLRFLYSKDIPVNIINRYKNEKDIKIIGLNEYLNLFNLNLFDDYPEYTSFLKYICQQNFMKKL